MIIDIDPNAFAKMFSRSSSRFYSKLSNSLMPFTQSEERLIANKHALLTDLYNRIVSGSYFPLPPRGYLTEAKHNDIPRFIPILSFQDNLVYAFCLSELSSEESIKRSANTYGGYQLGGKTRSEEEQELSIMEESLISGYESPYSFENSIDPRKMRGIWKQYQHASYIHSRSDDYGFFINIDISNFYDSINLDLLEQRIRSNSSRSKTSVIDLLFILLRHWNRSIEGYGRKTVGLPMEEIGDNSRILANFYLGYYDERMIEFSKDNNLATRFLRFADDQILMAPDKTSAESYLFYAADELRKNSLSINSGKVNRFPSREDFDQYWLFEDFLLLKKPVTSIALNQFADNYFEIVKEQRTSASARPCRSRSMLNALLYQIDDGKLSQERIESLILEVLDNGVLSSLDDTLIRKVRSVVPRSLGDRFEAECQTIASDERFNRFTFNLSRAYGSHDRPTWLVSAVDSQIDRWRTTIGT